MTGKISPLTDEDYIRIKKIYGVNVKLGWIVIAVIAIPLAFIYSKHYTVTTEEIVGFVLAILIGVLYMYFSSQDYRRISSAIEKRTVAGVVVTKTYDHANAELYIDLETNEPRFVSLYNTAGWNKDELNDFNVGDKVLVEETITNNNGIPRYDILRVSQAL